MAQEWMSPQDVSEVATRMREMSQIRAGVAALGAMPSLETAFSGEDAIPASIVAALTTMRNYVSEGLRSTVRMDELLGEIIDICSGYCERQAPPDSPRAEI